MRLVIFIICLGISIIAYYAVYAQSEKIKGTKNSQHLAILATIILLIDIFVSSLINTVFKWDIDSSPGEEIQVNEPEEENESTENQIDNEDGKNPGFEESEENELSEEPDDGEEGANTMDVITIDPINDVKLAIDSNEDNSISFESTIIEQFNGVINNEEQVDSYDFFPEIDGVYRFEFSDIPNNVSHSIYLYNSDGEELDRNTSIGNNSGITAHLLGGQKYVIAIKQSWNTGSYTLNIGHQKPSQVISEYSRVADAIQYTDQENDYVFVPDRDGLYRFEFSNIPNNVYHSIYVYNSNREELDRNTSIGNNSGITISLIAGKEYHIVVKQSGNIGSYILLIGKQKPIVDISKYTIISDSIQYTDQENVYDYIPKNDGLYRFEFANIPNDISHSIYLYNYNYEELDRNTSIGNGSGISCKLSANETYHIAVKQSGNVGSYDLLVGAQKEIVDISRCSSVTDSIQFTEQQNIYALRSEDNRDIEVTFSNVSNNVDMNLFIYNSKYEEIERNTGIGNDSGITISANAGSLYYIVVEQSWNYGNYRLNIN